MVGKLLILLAGFGQSEPGTPATAEPAVIAPTEDAALLTSDLKGLGHAEFLVREAAAKRLATRGQAVVAPLTELAETGSPEVSVRAFELLRKLYRDGDDATMEGVETAYEKLTQSSNLLAAARAESAIETVSELRHRRALASFRKLGGLVQFDSEEDTAEGAAPPRVNAVMINQRWKGGDDGLKYLRRIQDFRSTLQPRTLSAIYFIRGSKISDEALDSLKLDFGRALVERGPACLGVMQQQGNGEPVLRIDQVVEDSAAGRAGLKQDDIILAFDDDPIPDFATLVEKIGDRQPGDKIRILYSRDGEKQTTTAELLEWTLPPVRKRDF